MPAQTPSVNDAHARLVARLRDQAADIERITAGLSEEALATRIVPGKWSLKELVCHIWRVQEVFESRIEAMLTLDSPPVARYSPETDTEFEERLRSPAQELVEGFLTEREQFLTLLGSLSAADWRRHGTHPEFAHYDVHFQVEYMAHHEAHHVYQMFQRRAPLGRIPH
jgi:uncharacterized damage-inducible protein DinB